MERRFRIDLGGLEQIPVGQGKCFIVMGEEVAVFRSRTGDVSAVENRCPHRRGPLADGVIGGGKVICPLHGHKFDLSTGEGSERHECVRVFPVAVKNGRIVLEYILVSLPEKAADGEKILQRSL